MIKKLLSFLAIIELAFFSAVNYVIFVFPNRFAPAGIDGICTMIQDVLHINMGYLAFVVNIPLIIAAFIVLNREFALKSTLFLFSFSSSVILLGSLDMSAFLYSTNTGTSIVLAPVAAGTIRGLLYVATLHLNGSAGGVDIISALIKHKKPHLDLMKIIFILNTLIAISSYFVYGMTVEPVICSIMYSFLSSMVCTKLRSSKNEAVKFEIITQKPEQLCIDILDKLHQTATIITAQGAYSEKNTKVVLCIVKKEKAPHIEELLIQYQNCTVFKSIVNASMSGITYK